MKSKAIILTVLTFLSLTCHQSLAQIGLKVGIGVSDITFLNQGQTPYLTYEVNSLEHNLPVVTFQGGVSTNYQIAKRWGLQGELLFARRGLDYSMKFLYDNITYKININYLQVPILVRYDVFRKEKRQSGFLAGPYVGGKLSANKITKIDGQKSKTKVPNVKHVDFGIVAGYYVDVDLAANNQMVIDLKASYSLINMMNYAAGYLPKYYGPSKEYVRNVNISITVGCRLANLWSKKNKEQ